MKSYYYIYRAGHGNPTIKHETLDLAQAEAERLAGLFPATPFEILQCIGITRVTKPDTFWMDGVIPPHLCMMNRIMDGTCFVCGKIIGENDERMHHYQQRRASITGLMVELRKVIETGRLVVVA